MERLTVGSRAPQDIDFGQRLLMATQPLQGDGAVLACGIEAWRTLQHAVQQRQCLIVAATPHRQVGLHPHCFDIAGLHIQTPLQQRVGHLQPSLRECSACRLQLAIEMGQPGVDEHGGHGVPVWVKILCAVTMASGTACGGWRIIRTMGHRMVKLQPVHGFAAETSAASVLCTTAALGMPVSTTHVMTTSIMGVGCAKGFNHLRLRVVERILWAWVMTIPASGLAAYAMARLAQAVGWIH